MVVELVNTLFKQYAYQPLQGFNPTLADILIVVGAVGAAVAISIWSSKYRKAKDSNLGS